MGTSRERDTLMDIDLDTNRGIYSNGKIRFQDDDPDDDIVIPLLQEHMSPDRWTDSYGINHPHSPEHHVQGSSTVSNKRKRERVEEYSDSDGEREMKKRFLHMSRDVSPAGGDISDKALLLPPQLLDLKSGIEAEKLRDKRLADLYDEVMYPRAIKNGNDYS